MSERVVDFIGSASEKWNLGMPFVATEMYTVDPTH